MESINRIYVKEYRFFSFAKNKGKNLISEYGQKLLDSAKKSKTDAMKTASKRKNCATLTDCISKINNTQVDNSKDIDIVMPMYNIAIII